MPGVYDDEKTEAPLVSKDDKAPSGSQPGVAKSLANKEKLLNPNDKGGNSKKQAGGSKNDAGSLGDKESKGKAGGAAGAAAGAAGGAAGLAKKLGGALLGTNKRKAASGGLVASLVATFLGIFGFSTISGPYQAIAAGQLLSGIHMGRSDQFGDNTSAKFLLYALSGKAAKGRLGVIKNSRADKLEKRLNEAGLKSVYSPLTQRLTGYQILDAAKARPFLDDMEREGIARNNTANGGRDINGNALTGNQEYIGTKDDKFSTRRSVTRSAVRSIHINKVSSILGSRLLIKRGGVDFHPLKNVIRKQADKYADYRKKRQEDMARNHETGRVSAPSTPGQPDAPPPPDSPSTSKRKAILTKLKSILNSAKGPALAVGAACALKEFSGSIDQLNLENQQQILRLGMGAVTVASQTQSNKDTNLDEVGAYVDLLYDEKTGTAFTQDPGIQQELGEAPTGQDLVPQDTKPGAADKLFIFDVADTILIGPIAAGCDLIAGIASWGPFQVLSDASQFAIDLALKPFGVTSDELMQRAIQFFAGAAPNLLAQGAERGGLMNMGVREAVNSQLIGEGGSEMTPEEARLVLNDAKLEQKQIFAQASLYDKYLNLYEPQSAAATIARDLPMNRNQLIASIINIPGKLATTFSSILGMQKVSAAAPAPYLYTFPLYGFTVAEQSDPRFQNPFDVEAWIFAEPDRLGRLNVDYGKPCFDMDISPTGDLTYGESKDFTLIDAKCKDRNNEELSYYRFYLAYLISGLAVDCYEGNNKSCEQLGFAGTTPAAAAPGAGTPVVPGGPIIIGDTPNLACGDGVDKGVQDGYANGTLYKIKICEVQGIEVNAQIATPLNSLLNDAKAAGVTMSGGGFRTMQAQIDTRIANGCPDVFNSPNTACSPPTAKPGFSNHQMGLAIDFTQGGGIIGTSDSGFAWMQANAAKYGLINYAAEPWHWSYNGN